jgi:hypothetical protein
MQIVQRSNLYPGDVSEAVKHCKTSIATQYKREQDQDGMGLKWSELLEFASFGGDKLLQSSSNGEVFFKAGNQMIAIKELPVVARSSTDTAEAICKKRIQAAIHDVITKATTAATKVCEELDVRFPSTALMDALCVVCPRYWLQLLYEFGDDTIEKAQQLKPHLEVLYTQFGEAKLDSDGDSVAALVDKELLKRQSLDFCTYMSNQSKQLKQQLINQITAEKKTVTKEEIIRRAGGEQVEKLWGHESIPTSISEFTRLAHLILCIPFGSVENERRFSAMNITATDLRNCLSVEHLNTCLRISSSSFVEEDFPYRSAFEEWKAEKARRALLH